MAQQQDLNAVIDKAAAKTEEFDTKIESLSSAIATDEADLKAAAAIRAKELADFSAVAKELTDVIDTIGRAISILEREATAGASFAQMQGASGVLQALQTLQQAASMDTESVSKLTAFVQSSTAATDEDEETGAPDAAAYENQSGGIIETMQGLLDKAHASLDDARKQEAESKHNHDLFKQALEDKVKVATRNLDAAKKGKAQAEEAKATAEGDLSVTTKDLKADIEVLEGLHHECMSGATDFEEETASRAEELKALATAKKIIQESTGGATEQTYGGAASLVQVRARASTRAHADLSDFKLVHFVRQLARSTKSSSLLELSQRLGAAIEYSSNSGGDPFVKVKGLINDMLEKLLAEAEAEATKKDYCDKEMSETEANKADKEDTIETLTTRIDKMENTSKKLKEECMILQKELGTLAKEKAEADKARQDEHAIFVESKADMEQGVEGIKAALKVLREYYAADDKAHDAASGAGGGIVGMLEVAESDFSSGLAEIVQAETDAQAEYDKNRKEAEVTQAAKEQDLKFKTKSAKALDSAVVETSGDRDSVQTELDAVNEYYAKVKEECIAKPEPYEERKARREAEIAGLKEAMGILEGEAVFLQLNSATHASK